MVKGYEAMTHYDDEVLSRYMDGELTQSERVSVEEHLGACGQCREVLAALEFVRGAAAGASELEPPARLWQRIQEQIGSRARSRARLRWLVAGMPALAAAVVIAVLVAGRQQVSTPVVTASPELQVPGHQVAVDTGRRSPAAPGPVPVAAVSPGRRRATRPIRVEKVTPDEVGVESDDAVLAAAAEYRRYLEGLDRAIVESEEAMRANPGHPRVRLVHSQARASAVMAVEQLIPEGK